MSERRVHLRVRGHVQGVNFRYYAREEARRRGLRGWVRNREDGEVEIVAEGDANALAQFAAWCRRGPPSARVAKVEESTLGGEPRYRDFAIVYDAPE